MTALEEYTAHHAETAQHIMYRWGWRLFEGMFRRHLLRKAREELRQMRDLRLAALDANTNFDLQENQQAKQQRQEGLQNAYREALHVLRAGKTEEHSTEFEDDPLFAPLRRRAEARRAEIDEPLAPQTGMGRKLLEAT